MARMSREFSLVLVGTGVLTAGYFLFNEDEKLQAKQEEQARQQVSGHHRHYGGPLIFLHGTTMSNGRIASAATGVHGGSVRSAGIGSIGRVTAGG